MTGRKTLAEVRAELEAAVGPGPAGRSEVAESLRRFLAAGVDGGRTPDEPSQQSEAAKPAPAAKRGR